MVRTAPDARPDRARALPVAAALAVLWAGPALADPACLTPPYDAPASPDQTRLAAVLDDLSGVLAEFRSLDPLGFDAPPTLCLARKLDGAQAYYNPESNRIVLSRMLSDGLMQGVMLHELRHVDQNQRGFCPSTRLSMEANARASFAMEADASAVSLLAAWRMKELGHGAALDALNQWKGQDDVARAFVEAMVADHDAAHALAVAFDQWYARQARTEAYYIASCSDYLDRLDDSNALPSYNLLPGDYFDTLCVLPGVPGYSCTPPHPSRE